jgi:uncharacterized protein
MTTKIEQAKESIRKQVNTIIVDRHSMETGSGIKFYPLEAEVDNFNIEDIAHALSNICRWGGHSHWHFSVAQHSWLMSKLVYKENAFEALMHDATEAYLGDIPTPIKKMFPEYLKMEDELAKKLAKKFNFKYPFPEDVYEWDSNMKILEYSVLLKNKSSKVITKIYPEEAEKLFIDRYKELINERK